MSKRSMLLYVDSRCFSPYAMSSFVALHEKNVEFELCYVDLARLEHLEPAFTRFSLTRKVPVLVDGSFVLSESSAISEYINETVDGLDLYPGNAIERARTRQIQAWLRSDFLAIRAERPTEVIFGDRKHDPLSESARRQAEMLFEAAALWLEKSDCVCGQWSMADVDLTVMLSRLACCAADVPERLLRYVNTHWSRPSMHAWRVMAAARNSTPSCPHI